MLTMKEALEATTFYHILLRNKDGTALRARRTGKTKTWKRDPDRFSIPVKHGFKQCFRIVSVLKGSYDGQSADNWSTFDPLAKPHPDTLPSTAKDLYASDTTFRRAIDEWVETRRCDLRLVDYLLEQDPPMPNQADACRWAATMEDRPVYMNPATKHGERGGSCGPYPACNLTDKPEWCWCSMPHDDNLYAFNVPYFIPTIAFKATPADAILQLLDNWQERMCWRCGEREKRPNKHECYKCLRRWVETTSD